MRGAEPGDLLCVLDNMSSTARPGCRVVEAASTTVALSEEFKDWRPPNVEIKPFFRPSTVITATWPNSDQTPNIELRSFLGPTPGYTLTTELANGKPHYQLQLPTGVMTFTKPAAAGQPYVAAILEPAFAITATVAPPVVEGDLNVQVFPGDSIGGAASPWTTLQPVDPTKPITLTGVVPLDAPTLTGHMRIWAGAAPTDTVRTAVSQFFLSPVWAIDANIPGLADASTELVLRDVTTSGGEADFRGGIDWRVAGADFRGGARLPAAAPTSGAESTSAASRTSGAVRI